ncbi:MAG: hypothetical protein COA33_006015 [Fluviicola sp.]|nr:hypothetical protein [Fluviicola sp.]
MQANHQETIFEIIKKQIGKESLGVVVGEVLSISQDAVYRRSRGETLLTIYEIEKLSNHFNFSVDSIFGLRKNNVLFNFKPLEEFDFSMDVYLEGLLENVKMLKAQKNPELLLSVNNIAMFQLLNYPHLVRFKLFFWAKTYLRVPGYENVLFDYEKISPKTFNTGLEALKVYCTIPSKEIYDSEFLRGFVREIYYYYSSRLIKDPKYALYLLEVLDRFVDHLKLQAIAGKKFVSTTKPPANGNGFEMYYNETNNGNGTTYYHSENGEGLYIAHNMMNYVYTTDKEYIQDSLTTLNKQIDNSSMISSINEKERNKYFFQLKNTINGVRLKIEADLSLEE